MLEKGFSRYYLDRDAPKRDPEQLRLVRSLALSSSCDCGATCPPPGSILVVGIWPEIGDLKMADLDIFTNSRLPISVSITKMHQK